MVIIVDSIYYLGSVVSQYCY